jgi:hypothetical protein
MSSNREDPAETERLLGLGPERKKVGIIIQEKIFRYY